MSSQLQSLDQNNSVKLVKTATEPRFRPKPPRQHRQGCLSGRARRCRVDATQSMPEKVEGGQRATTAEVTSQAASKVAEVAASTDSTEMKCLQSGAGVIWSQPSTFFRHPKACGATNVLKNTVQQIEASLCSFEATRCITHHEHWLDWAKP